MPLSGHSVETYLETSSHATCQGTFGHSRLVARYRLTDDAPLSQQSRSGLTMLSVCQECVGADGYVHLHLSLIHI